MHITQTGGCPQALAHQSKLSPRLLISRRSTVERCEKSTLLVDFAAIIAAAVPEGFGAPFCYSRLGLEMVLTLDM